MKIKLGTKLLIMSIVKDFSAVFPYLKQNDFKCVFSKLPWLGVFHKTVSETDTRNQNRKTKSYETDS